MTVRPRIEMLQPNWSRWTGAHSTVPTAGSEAETAMAELDMGVVAAGANSDAKGLSLEFESDTDDSVFTPIRFWMANVPGLTGHVWEGEFAHDAAFPVGTLSTALTNGATMPTNPWDALSGTAAGASSGASDEYHPANNRIHNFLLQLQLAAGAKVWDQDSRPYSPPLLFCEFARTPTTSGLDVEAGQLDMQGGEGFVFATVELFYVDPAGNWHFVDFFKDDQFSFNITDEHVSWDKRKPKVTYHRARSSATSAFTFRLDSEAPEIEALASQASLNTDAGRRTLYFEHAARSVGIKERTWVVRYRTFGGLIVTRVIPRGVLSKGGEFTPGGDDFSGQSFTVTGLASGPNAVLMRSDWSDVPMETAILPINYATTA